MCLSVCRCTLQLNLSLSLNVCADSRDSSPLKDEEGDELAVMDRDCGMFKQMVMHILILGCMIVCLMTS